MIFISGVCMDVSTKDGQVILSSIRALNRPYPREVRDNFLLERLVETGAFTHRKAQRMPRKIRSNIKPDRSQQCACW
jgi:hypothetical protein